MIQIYKQWKDEVVDFICVLKLVKKIALFHIFWRLFSVWQETNIPGERSVKLMITWVNGEKLLVFQNYFSIELLKLESDTILGFDAVYVIIFKWFSVIIWIINFNRITFKLISQFNALRICFPLILLWHNIAIWTRTIVSK